jgi:hypothetical protein
MSTSTFFAKSKLLLFWDPLPGDPRFEKIVASPPPKHWLIAKISLCQVRERPASPN